MGKWIDNKYVEDAEGEARCGFSRSYFCGYENKTEFCKNNNMTRTTLEKILIILKQQFKDITLENILQEQANLSPQAVQLTQIEDAEEKKEEKKEEKYDKRKNNGRTPQPFLGYSSLTEFCKKKHTFIQTVKKIIQQLNEQGIEITEENIFKQRDLNRRHTQAFRKDRPNTDIKQISYGSLTEKDSSEVIKGWESLAERVRKELKKEDDMTNQDDNASVVNAIKETTNNNGENNTDNQVSIPPEAFNALLEAQIERRVQERMNACRCIKLLVFYNNLFTAVAVILGVVAFSTLMFVFWLYKFGFLKVVIN